MKNYKLFVTWFAALSCGRELNLVFCPNGTLRESSLSPSDNPTDLNPFESGLRRFYGGCFADDIDSVKLSVQHGSENKNLVLSGPKEYEMHQIQIGDCLFNQLLEKQSTKELTAEEIETILHYKIAAIANNQGNVPITSYRKTVREFDDPRPIILVLVESFVYEMQIQIEGDDAPLTPENKEVIKQYWLANLKYGTELRPISAVIRLGPKEGINLLEGLKILNLLCNIPGIQEKTNATFDFHNPNSVFTPKGLKDILQIIADDLPDDVELPGLIPPSQIRIKAREILDTNHQSCIEMLRLLGELHAQ